MKCYYYHSYILSCINYGNLCWRLWQNKLEKKINNQQKDVVLHTVFNKSKFQHTSELFKSG